MLAKLAGVVGRFVVGMLAIVGLVVVVIIWRLVDGAGKPAAAVQDQAAAAAVPAVEAPAAPGCECSAGAVCTGPRGGRYCLKPDGNKRYL